MPQAQYINIGELLGAQARCDRRMVYEDEYFRRETADIKACPSARLDIIIDSIEESGVSCCHISANLLEESELNFVFDPAEEIYRSLGKIINFGREHYFCWIPKDPAERIYDDSGRIEHARMVPFETKISNGRYCLTVKGNAGHRLEFAIVIFTKNVESFSRELLNLRPVELRKVIRSDWFCYEGVNDVWDYFIGTKIFSTAHRVYRKGFESQNVAFVLYYYLDYLGNQTDKQIYSVLRDLLAYSLMLSLPADNRWRHGVWTDISETHTVHQIAGIHILLSYYQRTGREVFLQKAKDAMNFLISIADNLSDDKIWFLHDTLETNMSDSGLFYKIFPSGAFGKSDSNTLCLNSHITTLIALDRLNGIAPAGQYGTCFEKGLNALKQVLGAKPADLLFYSVYGTRDLLIRRCTKTENKLAKKLNKVWTLILMRHLLPFLKKKFPRLVIPNGFIERDLTYSALSDFYHFRNLEDILILCKLTRADWLRKIITKSVKYTVDSGLADYVLRREPKAILFLDILILYSDIVDQQYLPLLPWFLSRFQKENSAVPVNILADPFITNTSLTLRIDNEDVIISAPAAGENIKAFIINPTDKDQKVMLKSLDEAVDMEIIDTVNRRLATNRKFVVPKMGFVKVVSKNG
ncbi:MAG TPA: hypothetical protein HPP87_01340 [Planctomycetes bacterium]|nr:hypothetical protein [Planctomycetota bacterium]